MCGIAGQISFRPHSSANNNRVEKMLAAMENRGPDGSGVYRQGARTFGHRRLKIIDLSERGHQPMFDAQLGVGVVFNGCIYNYQSLRAELETKSYKFFSNSDTEVLIKGFHFWGPGFVEKLEGMFAFAVWNQEDSYTYLYRDRLGIKPLYYHYEEGAFHFSSSLPAMLKSGLNPGELDREALQFYLRFHSVVPAPMTLFSKIRKIPAATVAKISNTGSVQMENYWRPDFNSDQSLNFEDAKESLRSCLLNAIKKRTVADVPVGVLLSGGLDSSLIVGMMAAFDSKTPETFSIGFEEEGGEKGDEFLYSDIIARKFSTKHHKIFIPGKKILENLDACIEAMSEPMISHDNIGFFLLSQEVSKSVTVVQSGQGADEVFAGYSWYPKMMESQSAVDTYQQVFFDSSFDEYKSLVEPSYQLSIDHPKSFVEDHFSQPGATLAVDKALRIDSLVMLIDDPVKRVDNMTMASSLEARVPFLDHHLVELAAKIPPQFKLKNGGKYILKELARDYIPHEVIDRPKGYFPVPQLKFIRGQFLNLIQETLFSSQSKERGLFKTEMVEKMITNPDQFISPLQCSRLWQVTLLERWLQCHLK